MKGVYLFLLSLLLCNQICTSTLILTESPQIEDRNETESEGISLSPIEQEIDEGIVFEPFCLYPPDSDSEKLEKQQKCLNKKDQFINLNLKYYGYKIQRSCFCWPIESLAQVNVTVCDQNSSVPEHYEDENTFLKIFDFLCDSFMKSDIVEVNYHEEYYFPTNFSVNYFSCGADGGISYQISDFQVFSENTCTV